MSALWALPALASTGVGSLPFDDPRVAAGHASTAYDLPFVPQLPAREGDMVAEWLGADPARCGWSSGRDRERPVAWDATIAALRARPPVHGLVKLQATGPVTLAAALEASAGPGATVRRLAVRDLARELAGWIAVTVADRVAQLAEHGLRALVVVDEPGLAAAGLQPADVDLWDPLRATGAAWGLHCCCAVPWRTVLAAAADGLDVLSFDLVRFPLHRDPEGVAALARLVGAGTRVAWGALDPVDPDGAARTAERVRTAVALVAGEGPPTAVVRDRSLLTPSCGTGRLDAERERLLAATIAAATPLVDASPRPPARAHARRAART